MLRAMAQHRGFKLVKSRRRKPGVGDYGRYGLAEGDKQAFGFGKNGLTATADDIANFLRSGELSAWGESIDKTPARARPVPAPASAPETEPAPAPRPKSRAGRKKPPAPARHRAAPPAPRPSPPPVETPPAPQLRIRAATKGDADAIAALLRTLGRIDVDAKTVADQLAGSKQGPSALVAQKGEVIGCVAWHVIPTLQRGPIGRITLLLVAKRERRRGTGTLLIDAAKAALEKQGCMLVEAVSDIEIRNSHGFFRALGFDQSSYRFTKRL